MLNRRQSPEKNADPREQWIYILLGLIFVGILLRLIVLQVLNRDSLRLKSIGNVITTIQTPALRGEIFDRRGQPLAANRNDLKLLYTPPPGIDNYFPPAADKARAKANKRHPYYYNRRYACAPIRMAADSLGLSYIELMQNLEAGLNFPGSEQEVMVAEGLDDKAAERFSREDNRELLQRLGFRLETGIDEKRRLYCRVPVDVQRFMPSAAKRLAYSSRNLDYHYMDLDASPEELRDRGPIQVESLVRIGNYLGIAYEQLMAKVEKENVRIGRPPYTIVDKLEFPQVVYIEEHRSDFPDVMIDQYSFNRAYPLAEAAGHLLGYTGLMSPEERSSGNFPFPLTDMVGKGGLERQYEELLHGRAGLRNLKVDKRSRYGTWVSEEEPQRGTNLYLTIDAGLQQECYRQLAGRAGAAIVTALEPGHQGEVLAFVSSPGIDPALIREQDYYDSLNKNPLKPLLNRASSMTYPPGSTFKMVPLTAALTTGVISPNTYYTCNGKIAFSDRDMWCHHRSGHGGVSLVDALAKSCDVYLYRAGMALKDPPADIKRFAMIYGYGEPTGLDLPDENSGFLPDKAWRQRRFAHPRGNAADRLWHHGRTCNYAIGQGDMLATPLQVLMSATLVATDGVWYRPHLVLGRRTDRQVMPMPPPEPEQRKLEHDALNLMRQGMRAAVTSGTCRQLNLGDLRVCAKSGTAQSHPGKPDHSWVTGYYPEANPRYAFVVLVEHGGSSGESAIPAMREILRYMDEHDPLSKDVLQMAELGAGSKLAAAN